MRPDEPKANKILRGPLFPKPVQVLVAAPMGPAVKLIGKGLQTNKVFEVVLTQEKLALLETTPDAEPFDGDSKMFRFHNAPGRVKGRPDALQDWRRRITTL